MRKIHVYIVALVLFVTIVTTVNAQNNIFGVHVSSNFTDDFKTASEIVNSNGGDWGYVTVVIQENNRNNAQWQQIFNQMRELHLIPIVRIATGASGKSWRRSDVDQLPHWASFLNGLNWPTKNRYVVLFNEPNHGTEWGGVCDPIDYGRVALEYAKTLKSTHEDFFVMLAGLDQSTPQIPPYYCDEGNFLQVLFSRYPQLADYIDGLASHSYPNPGFLGNPSDTGKGTIAGYIWELEVLKSLGVSKPLPVFITETSWPTGRGFYSEEKVADFTKQAFENLWKNDPRVLAVTLFDINIGGALTKFSLKNEDGSLKNVAHTIQSLTKIAGVPKQSDSAQILTDLPKKMKAGDTFKSAISVVNTGQAIWDEKNTYQIQITGLKYPISISQLPFTKPNEVGHVNINFTPTVGVHEATIYLAKDGSPIKEIGKWTFEIVKPPIVHIEIDGHIAQSEEVEIQIYDKDERLLYKNPVVVLSRGKGKIDDFISGNEGERYRMVVLKKRYLPRQNHFVLSNIRNVVNFQKMLGVDLDQDGQFTLGDMF